MFLAKAFFPPWGIFWSKLKCIFFSNYTELPLFVSSSYQDAAFFPRPFDLPLPPLVTFCFISSLLKITILTWITVTTGGAPEAQTPPATPVSLRGTTRSHTHTDTSLFLISLRLFLA